MPLTSGLFCFPKISYDKAMKKLPKIIKEVGFDFSWDESKVWALDYPVEEIDINELSWHFDIPFWSTADSYYDLKPNQVINESSKFQEEYDRTMQSDLQYPIDIMENKGRWLILDGLHRLVKAKIQNNSKIKVRKIPRDQIPNIKKL
jgi:hypothetical protein